MADVDEGAPDPTTPASVPSLVDIPNLIKQGLKTVQEGIQQAAGAAGAAVSLGVDAQKKEEEAANTRKEGTIKLNNAEAAKEQQLKAANLESAGLLGNLPGASSRLMTEVGSTILDEQRKVQTLQTDVADRKSVGFFDDPMQFIVNGFVTPVKEKELTQREHNIEQRLGIVKKIQDSTTTAAVTNAAVTTVDAMTKAESLNQVALADATAAIAASQRQLAQLNMSAASVRLATTTSQFSAVMQANQAQLSYETFNINKASADVGLTNAKIDTEIKKVQLLQVSEKEADRREFEDKLKVATAGLGLDITTQMQFDRAPNDMKSTILKVMGTQATFAANPGSAPPIAISPARAVDTLQTVGSIGASTGMAQVVNKVNDMKAAVADPRTNPTFNALKPESKFALEDQAIKTKVQDEYKNIPVSGGIYSPSPLRSVVTINPMIGNLPIIKELMPLAVNEQYGTNPQDFVSVAQRLVKEGKLSVQDAGSQISTVFKAMAADQNNIRQYGRLALPSMDTNVFNMSVQDPFGRTSVLNMSNPAAVQNFLMRSITAEEVKKAGEGTIGVGPYLRK
jgi:hypothetical protein